jgi:hypothetical protein
MVGKFTRWSTRRLCRCASSIRLASRTAMAQRPRSTSPQPLSLARSYGRTADTTPIDLARRPPRFPRFASKSSNAATPGKASLCCRAAGSWREPFHGSVAIDAWPGTRMRADAAPSVFDGPPAASRSSKPSRQTSAQTTSEIQAMLRYECSTLFLMNAVKRLRAYGFGASAFSDSSFCDSAISDSAFC